MSKMKFRNNIFVIAVAVLSVIVFALMCIIIRVSFNYYIENVNMYHSMVVSSFEDMRKNLAVNALQLIEEKEVWNVLKSENVDIEEETSVRNMVNEKYRRYTDVKEIIIVDTYKKRVFTNSYMKAQSLDEYRNSNFDFQAFFEEYTNKNNYYIAMKDYEGVYNQFFIYKDYRNYLVIFRLDDEAMADIFKAEDFYVKFDSCVCYNNVPFAFSGNPNLLEENILRYDTLTDKKYSMFGKYIIIADKSASASCVSIIKWSTVVLGVAGDIIWIVLVILILCGCVLGFLRRYSQKVKALQLKHYFDMSLIKKRTLIENQMMAFLKIFYGFHLSEKEQAAMEEYLVTDSDTVFRCMLIKWEGVNSGNVPEMVTTFNELIQKQLKHLGRVKTVKLGEGIIGVVLSDKIDSSDERIKNLMEKLYTDIIAGTKASLTIFISSKYYGMNDFIEKAPMLLKMQDITFFNKENRIIFDSIYEQFSNTIPYPIQTEQKALEALSNGENDKYKEQIDRFINRIKQTTPFVAKCYLSIFATNVVNYTKITNKAISEDIISMVEISENLDKTAEIFKNVVTEVKLATAERDEKFCDNVIDFIEKNYTNYDFCVSDLSDYLGVSASYAGKKFRNKFGQSFNNYLSELRIEKAAELLTTSNIKLGKLGEMCGFRTDAYFVTIFKKIKKMSPQEYRKLYSVR